MGVLYVLIYFINTFLVGSDAVQSTALHMQTASTACAVQQELFVRQIRYY